MRHRITFFAVMMMALAIPQSVMAYDFSAQATSGQTLYYSIIDGNSVSVVSEIGDYPYYTDVAKPTGDLVIPSSVTDGNTTYSVTSIGGYAFYGCSGLTSVTIPEGVTSIGDYAFEYCSGLTSISVESGNTVYDSREGCNAIIETATNTLIAGCKNTVIPTSVTSIGDYAFFYCSGLTSVTIPSSVTYIGMGTFEGCSGLTSVTIPEGVTSIGNGAFYYCSGLTSVTIPGSVTSIGDYAFELCSSLTSVTIPSSVTSIGVRAFAGCSGLTSISVESGNTVYDSRENCNAIIETATNTLIAGCMNTVIPEGVTSIGDYAFAGCSGLTSVTIPSSVTSIGNVAFGYCSGLTSIECLALVPPTMGYYVFDGVPSNIPVYVPCGKVTDYQTANGWSSFANIQELDGCIPAGPTNIAVYADGNDIVVEGAAGNTVTLYDNGGNTLSTSTAPTGTPLRFEGLANGTYYVKIGVLPARMKVEVR